VWAAAVLFETRKKKMEQKHFIDSSGNPAGGISYGVGFAIGWQNGPLSLPGERLKPNGAFVEEVLLAVVGRLEFYQNSKFQCKENKKALDCLATALGELRARTIHRRSRGVEGTHET